MAYNKVILVGNLTADPELKQTQSRGEAAEWGDGMSEWIKTSERLPEIGRRVLGVTYGTDIIIKMDGETTEECLRRCRREPVIVSTFTLWEDGWSGAEGFPAVIQPTYWMPLPPPPKYEEE